MTPESATAPGGPPPCEVSISTSTRSGMAAWLAVQEGMCSHFSAVIPGHPDLFPVNALDWAVEEIWASGLLICNFDGRLSSDSPNPWQRRRKRPSPPQEHKAHPRPKRTRVPGAGI